MWALVCVSDIEASFRMLAGAGILGVAVERDQRAILLRLGGFLLPTGPRHGFGVKCRSWETRVIAPVGVIHVRLSDSHGELKGSQLLEC